MDELLALLERYAPGYSNETQGVYDWALDELEEVFGQSLPGFYREFARVMGEKGGPLLSARFGNSVLDTWQATGESITLSAPPEQPARYRISLRQMVTSATGGMSYCIVTLTASTSSLGTPSVNGMGIPHGNPTFGYWQTVFGEGVAQLHRVGGQPLPVLGQGGLLRVDSVDGQREEQHRCAERT